VVEAGVINLLPFSGLRTVSPVEFEGKPDQGLIPADPRWVTPGYFSAMGIRLVRGRYFAEQDNQSAPPVGIIDEQLAVRMFGDEDPVGKRFRFGVITSNTPWVEIVGVVSHIRNENLEADPRPQLYWPQAQHRAEAMQAQDRGALVVRTSGQPESFTSAVVQQIQVENPDQPVYDVRSMETWMDRSMQSRNLMTGMVTLFGGASLLLACLGLYGVVSYGAALRLREFAIRMALGAQPSDVRRLVLAHAGRLAVIGSAIGLVAAWPAGRALQSLLYGVGTADAVALAAAPLLLLVTALLAGLGPALKAGRVDPAVRLRGE
jgi:predicted permease